MIGHSQGAQADAQSPPFTPDIILPSIQYLDKRFDSLSSLKLSLWIELIPTSAVWAAAVHPWVTLSRCSTTTWPPDDPLAPSSTFSRC